MWRPRIGSRVPSIGRPVQRRSVRFEQLEPRQLMAVTTSLANGTLSIAGDAGSDDIAIVGTANPGEFAVTGRNGTRINGVVNGTSTIAGVTADLAVDLAAGDDVLAIDNAFVGGNIILELGGGDDAVVLGGSGVVSPNEDLQIDTGDGDDQVSLLGYNVYIAGEVFLETGVGSDEVTLVGASAVGNIEISDDTEGADAENTYSCLISGVTCASNLEVYGDAGANSVAMLNTAATLYLYAQLEEGRNTIYVDTCYCAGYISMLAAEYEPSGAARAPEASSSITVARCASLGLQVYGGNGDDTINVIGNLVTVQPPFDGQPETLIVLYIDGGAGNDTVTAQYNFVINILSVQLGDGDDALSMSGNYVASTAGLDGGLGGDALSLFANSIGGLFRSSFP